MKCNQNFKNRQYHSDVIQKDKKGKRLRDRLEGKSFLKHIPIMCTSKELLVVVVIPPVHTGSELL